MYRGLHVQNLLFLSECNEAWNFSTYWNIRFHENPSSRSRVLPWGRTDVLTDRQTDRQTYRQTDTTKRIVACRKSANVPDTQHSAVKRSAESVMKIPFHTQSLLCCRTVMWPPPRCSQASLYFVFFNARPHRWWMKQLWRELHSCTSVEHISRSQWPRGLRRRSLAARLLRSWVRIPPGAWMFVVSTMCCQVEVSATGWSLVQTSPTDCGASLCVIKKPREWGG